MAIRKYTENSIEHIESIPPEGFALIQEQHPDINGEMHAAKYAREIHYVFSQKGIPSESHDIKRNNLAPMGSGPGGRIRFGDSMMPSIHRIYVPADKLDEAFEVLLEHRAEVRKWLFEGGPIPEACKI